MPTITSLLGSDIPIRNHALTFLCAFHPYSWSSLHMLMNSTFHEMQERVSTPCYRKERQSTLTKREWTCVIFYLHLSWQKELLQLTQCPGLITTLPAEATAPPGYLSCSWQSSPTHFSLNKQALLKKAVSKSLLTQLNSSTLPKAAQAGLPLARMGS